MQRFKFVLYRPVQLIPVLFGISIITFVMIQSIPGDPIRTLLGIKATPERSSGCAPTTGSMSRSWCATATS